MNLSRLDLNLLRVLEALLREGSTVKAAADIGLSQPAVSAALGRLRHALGDDLFVRRGQGLEPTDYARSLEIPLRDILARLEALLSGPRDFDPATDRSRIRLSGSDFFAELLMPALAARLSKLAPAMRVQLFNLVSDRQLMQLAAREVDILLVPAMPLPEWADSQAVLHSPLTLIARHDHPRFAAAGLRPGDAVPLDLYCALGHVIFSPEGELRGRGDDALAHIGRRRKVAMTMPVFSGVYHAVSESDLIALIPDQLAERIAPRAGLALYRPPVPIAPVELAMIWHKRSSSTPAHRWLRGLIADILRPLDQGAPAVE
jgi:DNA-binding transcriptional LysR family regulator